MVATTGWMPPTDADRADRLRWADEQTDYDAIEEFEHNRAREG